MSWIFLDDNNKKLGIQVYVIAIYILTIKLIPIKNMS